MFDIPNVTPRGFKQPVSETLPAAVARIAQALHPQKIILFGSYAYGNPTPDSDLDLLVVVDRTASVNERTAVRREVSEIGICCPFPLSRR